MALLLAAGAVPSVAGPMRPRDAGDLSGMKPAGESHLVASTLAWETDEADLPGADTLAITYRFESDAETPSNVFYDLTSLQEESLPQWTPGDCLGLEVKLPEGVELLVQVQGDSGRWFQGFFAVTPDEWVRLAITLDRRTFPQSWTPGTSESYRSSIDLPIRRLRIGVRGKGEGTAYIRDLAVRPVYGPAVAPGNATVTPHPAAEEMTSLQIEGAPKDAAVIHVKDYGARPDDGQDDTQAIRAALEACRALPAARVELDPGRYDLLKDMEGVVAGDDLDQIALLLADLSNLTLAGQGTELILHKTASALVFRRCRNIVVSGLAIDWENPPYAQGVVVKEYNGALDIQLEPGYDPEQAGTVNMVMRFDSGSRLLDDKEPVTLHCGRKAVSQGSVVLEYVYAPWETFSLGDGVVRMQCNDEAGQQLQRALREGDLILLRYGDYRNNGITIMDSDRIALRDVSIYAAAGMGYWANNSSNLHLDGFAIEPRPGSGRLMSVTADGVHFKDCFGVLMMENSTVVRQADDCLNIKSRYHRILEQFGERLTLKLWRPNSMVPEEGERFALFSAYGEELGSLTLSNIEATDDPLVWEAQIDPTAARNWKTDAALLASLDRSPERVVVRNCNLGENRGRGILLQARNVLIEGNRIHSTSDRAIWVTHDPVRFGEAFPPSQVMIRNNRIIDCPRLWRNSAIQISAFLTEVPPGVRAYADIQILDNELTELPFDRASGITVADATDVVIAGNILRKDPEPACLPGYMAQTAPMVVENCENVLIRDNVLEAPRAGPIILDESSQAISTIENNKNLIPSVFLYPEN
ncbi:MAG: right-handed parallel beta-helix repeat-containing protein [Verrucomicrobiota bacterium JB024]|nr:right-handed parallel beta-helix repeat-containing protein [Verrucomicrobiota bacterium JB024]